MSELENLLKENSRNLRSHYNNFNPMDGDPNDPERFLFKVKGLRKSQLPDIMRKNNCIWELLKCKSLQSFVKTRFYKKNFSHGYEVADYIDKLRMKHDFLYWISRRYPDPAIATEHRFLIRRLQSAAVKDSPIRIIIRKPFNMDISQILLLYIIWLQSRNNPGLNAMCVVPSAEDGYTLKDFFRVWNEESVDKPFRVPRSTLPVYYSRNKSRINFCSQAEPAGCRSLDYSILYFKDTHRWPNSKTSHLSKVMAATYPVVLNERNTAVIIEAGPCRQDSLLGEEIRIAHSGKSDFKMIEIPWFENHRNKCRFDFREEKEKFLETVIANHELKRFPTAPFVDDRYIHSLLEKGIPLETLYWYVTESRFYKTRKEFVFRYPPDFP